MSKKVKESKKTQYIYSVIYKSLNVYREIQKYYNDNKIPDKSDLENISIPLPRLNSQISESLIYNLIDNDKIISLKYDSISFSIDGGDLVGIKNNRNDKIEIKSTGKSEFQYFSDKDINADFIVWVLFGDFISNNDNKVTIIIIPKLSEKLKGMLPESLKLTFSSLKNKMEAINHPYNKLTLEMSDKKSKVLKEEKVNKKT